MYKTLKVDVNDNIAIVTLARPEIMNAFNEDMALDLLRAFEALEDNADVRAILLRGEGKAFCVGGDISMFANKLADMPSNIPDMMEVLNATITTMLNASKPILASVHGAAAGVGMSFLMASDLVIASESCKFNIAYAGIGLTPDGGASYLLPRLVGQRRAAQMLLLPEVFSSSHAVEIGLVNWIAKDDELDKETSNLMYRLANGPTLAYKRAKHLLSMTWHKNIDDQLLEEMHAFTECTISKDFSRGVTAFLNKQLPIFEGD
jgi:2-(1,2-epoxy-1,2-dihydrophenyl)acetyl-CoA isomerase